MRDANCPLQGTFLSLLLLSNKIHLKGLSFPPWSPPTFLGPVYRRLLPIPDAFSALLTSFMSCAALRWQQSGPRGGVEDKYLHICLLCWRECLCHDILDLLKSPFPIFQYKFMFPFLNTFQFPPHKLLLRFLSPYTHCKHQDRNNIDKNCFVRLYGEFFRQFEKKTDNL